MTVHSNQRNPWRRLKKNKAAVAGMIVIILAFFVAVFAYYISPDSSHNANRMIVEIGGRKPGFKQQFLLLPKEGFVPGASFLERLLFGKSDRFDYIPIEGYRWRIDSVIISKYIDEG